MQLEEGGGLQVRLPYGSVVLNKTEIGGCTVLRGLGWGGEGGREGTRR